MPNVRNLYSGNTMPPVFQCSKLDRQKEEEVMYRLLMGHGIVGIELNEDVRT